jgi:DNA-directed RNA polymerase subunit RPC12/RpoP
MKCVICNKEFEGYGNNPEPVKNKGRCCDECNAKFVIPARLKMAKGEK